VKEFIFLILIFSNIPLAFSQEFPELGVKVETIADNLEIPWAITWAPDETIFFTERNGNVKVIKNGLVMEKPILSIDVSGGEGGLLGITLDPKFFENHFVYLYFTYSDFLSTKNKVVRYYESNLTLTEDKTVIDNIPGSSVHDGGRIKFGPDGKLYITTGEAGDPNLSQDLNSLAGKILRINSDGTIPEDNPFPHSPVFSYGHRNPQGLDWDVSGKLVATEHGPTGWRGVAHDEVNLIYPGLNYGWPKTIGSETKSGFVSPILESGNETWAPSGAEFYYGNQIPQWTGKYFIATLRGNHLHMIDFDLENNQVLSQEKLFLGNFGRLRDVATGSDGYLYLLTSNQDGRGIPNINDDKILRIVPIRNINNFEDCMKAGNPIIESYPRQCQSNGKIFVEISESSLEKIPDWVRKIFIWYGQNQISENELLDAIKYLIQEKIIIIN
jgi:glucose/arabinose dehydrogenase